LADLGADWHRNWMAVWHILRRQLGAPRKGALRRQIALQGTRLVPALAQQTKEIIVAPQLVGTSCTE
jgi:hypothetical protein